LTEFALGLGERERGVDNVAVPNECGRESGIDSQSWEGMLGREREIVG
jgi:hypothetical protein